MEAEELAVKVKVLQGCVSSLNQRQTIIEEVNASLARRMQELESQRPPQPAPQAARSVASRAADCSGASASTSGADTRAVELGKKCGPSAELRSFDLDREESEVALEGSVWDACLLVGSPCLGRWGFLSVCGAALLNIVIQVVFCGLVWTNFTDQEFSPEDLSSLKAWRLKVAHDNRFLGANLNHSLVSRVCGLDMTLEVSTDQASKVELIRRYLPSIDPFHSTETIKDRMQGVLDGRIMCMIAVTCWVLTVGKEVGSIGNMLSAILVLPSSDGSSTKVASAEGGAEIVGATRRSKAFMALVCIVRLVIAISLLIMGCIYLAYTSSMQDLLLNAVALECVFTIDELIFEALAPRRARMALTRLAPLKLPPWSRWPALDLRGVATFVGLVATLMWLGSGALAGHVQNLKEVHEVLCSGVQDFSIVTDGLGMVHYAASSPFDPEADFEPGIKELAVQELLEGNAPTSMTAPSLLKYGLDPSMYGFEVIDLDRVRRMSIASLTSVLYGDMYRFFLYCHDALDLSIQSPWDPRVIDADEAYARSHWQVFRNQRRVWLSYLTFGGGGGQSCPDFAHRCSEDIVLSLCPVTCGCESLLGGVFQDSLEGGCPVVCRQPHRYPEKWATTSSVDRTEYESTTCQDADMNNPIDPKRLAMLGWAPGAMEPLRSQLRKGCSAFTSFDLNIMCKSPPRIESANPLRTTWNDASAKIHKLITYTCPVTCNCKGLPNIAVTAKNTTCPRQCYRKCPWKYKVLPTKSVGTCNIQPLLHLEMLPVQASGECCHLLNQFTQIGIKLLSGAASSVNITFDQELQIWKASMCDPCFRKCLNTLASLRVIGTGRTFVEETAVLKSVDPATLASMPDPAKEVFCW